MQGLHEYIIEIPEALKNSIELSGGTKLYVDPTFNQQKWSNRIGKVISKPIKIDSEIEKGDEVLIIDTVLFSRLDKKKGRVKSHFLLDEEKGWYRVPKGLIVMYRKANKDWSCYLNNILLEPVFEKKETGSGLVIPDVTYQKEVRYQNTKKQYGKVAFINSALRESGVKEGDIVYYRPDVDYKFSLEGKEYYHIQNEDVLAGMG